MVKRGFCQKCKKVTEFTPCESVGKAGDAGTTVITGYRCEECQFMPLLAPKWED